MKWSEEENCMKSGQKDLGIEIGVSITFALSCQRGVLL